MPLSVRTISILTGTILIPLPFLIRLLLPLHALYFYSIYEATKPAAAAKSFQFCLTLCDPIDGSPPGSPIPGILQAKNTGVGCHFLLQCMKVKRESEVAQSCPTPSNPMDYSLPGSSVYGICQARVLGWFAIAFSLTKSTPV